LSFRLGAMPSCSVKYGQGTRSLALPPGLRFDTLAPGFCAPLRDPIAAVRTALRNPIGTPPLQEIVSPGERVAIVVNDITRLAHSDVFLPVVVDELNLAGIPDRDMVIVFALGIHRRQTAKEQRQIVGKDLARRISLIDHDAFDQNNLSFVGRTTYGNEIWVNRRVREANRVILTGEIIYHLIAGYSGGCKSLVPGVAGAATISFNHKFILDPRCRAGALDGNPAHGDMLEACGLFKPDFLLNVILNANGELSGVVAGHYDQAHRAGCETVNEIHRVPFECPYDVVIASAGGFPFDIDLRQAHKGMENAARALCGGGTLLYFAECREGAGGGEFSEWAERFSSSGEMALALRSHFVVGGHKAYWIARLGERMRVLLISDLPETLVRNCHLFAVSDPATALRTALEEAGPDARVAYIPDASLTFPSSSMEARATPAAA
jgi:nickel-dependent lactate racemase